jgi:flagellar basal-body rod protein FlgG
MNGAFYIGATGLDAEQRALDAIANNIANINTPAYKRYEVRFGEIVAAGASDEELAPTAASALLGVHADTAARVFEQGAIKPTGRALDVAIDGDGFIELIGPEGQVLLSRGGSLTINPDGFLASPEGFPLKAMISAPLDATDFAITPDGLVYAAVAGQSKPSEIGKIDLVRVKDMSSLKALDGGLFSPANEADLVAAEPGQDGAGRLAPAALESSNVELADEMVTLLLLQRAYAANAQVVQAGDQLMSIANNLRR